MPVLTARFAVAAMLIVAPATALADAIDGDWCKATDQFSIAGPRITTPAGLETSGNYDRHGFNYRDEDGGFDKGAEIRMELLNEETLRVFVGAPDMEGVIWHRCDFVS